MTALITVFSLCSSCAGSSPAPLGSGTAITAPAFAPGLYRGNWERTGEYAAMAPPPAANLLWTYTSKANIAAPPVIIDGLVYLVTENSFLTVLDAQTGTQQWQIPAYGAAPGIAGDMVYYGRLGVLHALELQGQQEKWNFKAGGDIEVSPVITNSMVYFGDHQGDFYALDQTTGTLKWQQPLGKPLNSDIVVAGDRIYIAVRDSTVPLGGDNAMVRGQLYALDRITGRVLWNFNQGDMIRMPILSDNIVYCLSGFNATNGPGYIYALDSQTGKELWRYSFGQGINNSGTYVLAQDGMMYVTDTNGYLHEISTANRADQKLTFKTALVSLANSVLYIASGPYVLAVDRQTKQEQWRFRTKDWLSNAPVLQGGTLYIADSKNVYALR